MLEKIVHEFELDGVPFKIEANEIGQQAQSALLVTYGETTVFVTVAVGKSDPNLDFFPLTVDYSEKLYASGIISSSPYIKREGRPTEKEILSGRLIDHAIRSLFDPKFKNETQVIVQVWSYDKVHDPVLTGIMGVSFALQYSGLPFLGPYGATLVGHVDGKLVYNPTLEDLKKSTLEMYVSSVSHGIVSVEAEGHDIPDEEVKEGIKQAVKLNERLIEEQLNFTKKYGKKEFDFKIDEERAATLERLLNDVLDNYKSKLEEALYHHEKTVRNDAVAEVRDALLEKYAKEIEEEVFTPTDIELAVEKVNKKIVRKNILSTEKRPDGRKIDEVRELKMRVGVLPRVHGSALFSRGETQSLTIVTLGTDRDALNFQGLEGDKTNKYFHHYNMPGYANGEVDRKFGMPNRRAIGHGAIGEKALRNMIPDPKESPYTIRVVSEITASNGSTSMAATCASSLALMDAGIPLKKIVGGIGVGLVFEGDPSTSSGQADFKILTDIIGMEDFYGDMDFKITGSKDGITAIQLDNKMSGIPVEILMEAIDRSKTGRIFVISEMEKCKSEANPEVSKYAPHVKVLQIKPDKIGELIGPGGKIIRNITETTGVEINVDEDGKVMIYASQGNDFEKALAMVQGVVQDLEAGMEFDAVVVRVEDYGAFIEVPNTKIQGLVHVSHLGMGHIDDVKSIVHVGDKMRVKFMGFDEKRRTKFVAVTDEKVQDSNIEKTSNPTSK